MTVKEYLTKMLLKFDTDNDTIDLLIVNQKLNADDEVSDVTQLKKAIYHEFYSLIPLADISEGGYSIKWNWEAFKFWYSILAKELGLPDPTQPKIRDKSNKW